MKLHSEVHKHTEHYTHCQIGVFSLLIDRLMMREIVRNCDKLF